MKTAWNVCKSVLRSKKIYENKCKSVKIYENQWKIKENTWTSMKINDKSMTILWISMKLNEKSNSCGRVREGTFCIWGKYSYDALHQL